MSIVENAIGQLTKDDISALRKAHTASFHWTTSYDADAYRWRNNIGSIRLTRRIENAGPLDERERTYEIAVECRLTDYADQCKATGWHSVKCFDMEHTCSMSEEWQTIIGLVRQGDEIRLEWVKDNSNGYLNECGLHRDELSIVVKRGERKMHFKYSTFVGADNTARMVCRY